MNETLYGMIQKMSFMVEILFAELIYLYPAEKRPYFWVRFPALFVLCCGAAAVFPINYSSLLSQFLMFLLMFALSVGAMALCFKMQVPALVSCCVAGYATEHIAFHIAKIAGAFGFLTTGYPEILGARVTRELCLFPVIYFVFWLAAGRYAAKNETYKKVDLRFNYLSFAIIFLCIGLTRVAAYFEESDSVTVSLYAIAACGMALIVQLVLSETVALQNENNSIRMLWEEDRKQYALSKATIDTINIKYHDLKHQLHGMNLPQEEIDKIKDAVRVYGSRIRTGNEALDVLLTENSLRCGEQGIQLTYTGNGADFSFMNVMDVYSLFGNAVSNAVEAVQKVKNPEKRVIDILSERKGDLINITVTNYFSGQLVLDNGLPVTTKAEEKGFHGYGMKSMQLIAQKYGGNLHCSADGDLFMLHIYLLQQ